MLPRRLIMDHSWLVAEGLMLRSLGAEDKETLVQVHALGQKVLQAQKDKEELQQQRNILTKRFQNGDNVSQESKELKVKLEQLEKIHKELEEEIHAYEICIPNLPGVEVPIAQSIWDRRGILDLHLDTYEKYVEAKRKVLSLLHYYLGEYNG